MSDLSALDGSALLGRLAVVKERVLDLMDHPSTTFLAARADTEAVLDECAVRLLEGPEPLRGPVDAVSLARVGGEVDRLRRLIRAVVARGAYDPDWLCYWCNAKGPHHVHDASCPWGTLVAEAEKA